MKRFRLGNILLGWFTFVVAAVVYSLTIEPTSSFWDCGEFIASAYKLEVGHPPGAPFFMLVGRIFSLFAFGEVLEVAKMINLMSALVSALTIMFLFWTITHIARKVLLANQPEYLNGAKTERTLSLWEQVAVLGSGLVGALAYTFSDTFWFSAVEGEVYGMSSLFTAVVFWAILKWENIAHEKYADRWLILIAYLMGLSIGVHLLNLLAIPAIVFVYYFKKYPQVNTKGIVYAGLVAVALLGAIMYGVIQGLVKVAAEFELLFTNSFGLPYYFGIVIYAILLLGAIVWGLYSTFQKTNTRAAAVSVSVALTLMGIPFASGTVLLGVAFLALLVYGSFLLARKNMALLNTILLAFTVILIGYSSFALIVIRSLANPPMDENNPENVFALRSYLNREQYGDRPLLHGAYYNAPIVDKSEGKKSYIQKGGKYVVSDVKPEYEYDSRFTTIFPRMYSSAGSHVKGYKSWAKIKGKSIQVRNPRTGENEVRKKPTFVENIRFFFRYQIGQMYFRYFMWNFAGRQNDEQGHGGYLDGNWISGISAIDNAMLGNQEHLPKHWKASPARNQYYLLPLLLGILGLAFLFSYHPKYFSVVFLLFFFTGIAIVIYLNQTPYQPRERDYAYAGSFYSFAIWIGMSVVAIVSFLKRRLKPSVATGLALLVALPVPALMAAQNWDDHDRSGRYTVRHWATNYLESCAPNAILFTYGDNDTFPLWYVQEVEGVRTDVRVVNMSLLSGDWYIEQMTHKAYESEPLPISMTFDKYVDGTRDFVPVYEKSNTYEDIGEVMQFVASDDPATQVGMESQMLNYIPAKKLKIPVNRETVLANQTVSPQMADSILAELHWDLNRRYLTKNDLMVLEIIANNKWERPIYFAVSGSKHDYLNLHPYFRLEGFAYRLVPYKTPTDQSPFGHIDTQILYENLMNRFQWGGMEKPGVYIDQQNRRVAAIMGIRETFAALATSLAAENKPDSAIAVLDRSTEIMPPEKFPFEHYILPVIEAYYKANAPKKANALIRQCMKTSKQELDFYFNQNTEKVKALEYNIRISLHILRTLRDLAEAYQQRELFSEINTEFQKYFKAFEISQ